MNDTALTLTLPVDDLVQNDIVLSKLTFIEEIVWRWIWLLDFQGNSW